VPNATEPLREALFHQYCYLLFTCMQVAAPPVITEPSAIIMSGPEHGEA